MDALKYSVGIELLKTLYSIAIFRLFLIYSLDP